MIICGTGHRPNKLGGYSLETEHNLFRLARHWIAGNKPTSVISGMAMGWDMALAHAAIHLDTPLIAAVPFKGQENMWPTETQNFYAQLLERANEVVYVCEDGYAPWKMQVRNVWMVDHADVVLALWDGSKGGTGNCVAYANKVSKPIVNLWDEFNVKGEG